MLSDDEIITAIYRVTYMPGWEITPYHTAFQGLWVAIRSWVVDAYDPEKMTPLVIRSPIPPVNSEAELYSWLRWRLERIAIHEVHEWLRLDGVPLFDPHDSRAVEPAEALPVAGSH